jgi:hypothetical protein
MTRSARQQRRAQVALKRYSDRPRSRRCPADSQLARSPSLARSVRRFSRPLDGCCQPWLVPSHRHVQDTILPDRSLSPVARQLWILHAMCQRGRRTAHGSPAGVGGHFSAPSLGMGGSSPRVLAEFRLRCASLAPTLLAHALAPHHARPGPSFPACTVSGREHAKRGAFLARGDADSGTLAPIARSARPMCLARRNP